MTTPRSLLAAGSIFLVTALLAPRLGPLPGYMVGLLYGAGLGTFMLAAWRSQLVGACEAGSPAVRRRYLREFTPAMLGYVGALFLSLWLLKRIDTAWLRAVIALLPVPPIALAMRAIMRYIRDADELQRRIELEAVSMATALISLLYMAAAFLQLAGVIDIASGLAMLWMFPLVCLTYGVAKVAVARRYR